jgi:hypothetical protein
MVITYPLLTVVDDSGAIVSGATVAITSVKDKAGADIATPGATISQSGANVSVDYDAETKGDAWIVLAISKAATTFTGLNAAPAFFLARDPSRVLSGISATGKVTPDGARVLSAPRLLDGVADNAITADDAAWAAVCEAAGRETTAALSTAYVKKTPAGTVFRNFVLDVAPTVGPFTRT